MHSCWNTKCVIEIIFGAVQVHSNSLIKCANETFYFASNNGSHVNAKHAKSKFDTKCHLYQILFSHSTWWKSQHSMGNTFNVDTVMCKLIDVLRHPKALHWFDTRHQPQVEFIYRLPTASKRLLNIRKCGRNDNFLRNGRRSTPRRWTE